MMALWLLFLVLFLGGTSWLESATSTRTPGNETDRLALLSFKEHIIDDPYGVLQSWNNSNHFCSWVGVTCGRRHRRVILLDLVEKGLGGNISPSIGNLSFLRVIKMKRNRFIGKIPQEVGNLIRLQYISIANNSLSGELPTSLANCTQLRTIRLGYNNLTGEIPVEMIMALSKLEVFSINYGGITGEIPPQLGNISTLQTISLSGNELQGRIPKSFGQLINLDYLSLNENKLYGMFPLSLFNLSSLQTISVADNHLHGSLPREIGLSLPNLEYILIGGNLFSGSIPSSISNISTLEMFDIAENSFVGPVPSKLGSFQNLQVFQIDSNQFGTREVANDLAFVDSLVNCTSLVVLALEYNGFKGLIPNFKANLSTKLSELSFSGNQISETIPSGIENLMNLTLLTLDENFLQGNIPSGLGKLQKLQTLWLSENELSGQIPSSLGNLTLLYELHVEANNLSGRIPPSLGNFEHLQRLILRHNYLQGSIPKQLFQKPAISLIFLDLSYNSLEGSLPIEIGNLKALSTLDVSKNRLFGEIPISIGGCNSLEHLYMASNSFKGSIPQSLISIKGLQDLDLSHNNLSSQIPKDLGKLSVLQSLNLSFNNLEGEMPTKGIFGNVTAVSVKGNDKLCGGILEFNLPTCKNHGSQKQEKLHAFKLVLKIISMVLSFLLISSFLALLWIRKSKGKSSSTQLIGNQFPRISYRELFQATEGFSSANFLGSGSFGSVYKGVINQDETTVAVKILNLQNPRAYKSFIAECEALRNIRHRNLVKILTCCSSLDSKGQDFKALVYEFMPNGSLDDWLHISMEPLNYPRNLSLLQRLNIAIDVASALDYLHCHCYVPIVHCDLKPSNVLLDSAMTAHVSDFGLATLLLKVEDNSFQAQTSTTGIKGSIGYIAPEYGTNRNATTQGDVFSYGILLLEMFIGKRPTDPMFAEDLNLHNYAKAALPIQGMQILDPTLLPEEGHDEEIDIIDGFSHWTDELKDYTMIIIKIALQCSMESPRERMHMSDVVKELHLIKDKFLGGRLTSK